jgi:hypothetical protein
MGAEAHRGKGKDFGWCLNQNLQVTFDQHRKVDEGGDFVLSLIHLAWPKDLLRGILVDLWVSHTASTRLESQEHSNGLGTSRTQAMDGTGCKVD